jgi:hypothetical protein
MKTASILVFVMTDNNSSYTCGICNETFLFDSDWDDDAAKKQAVETFPECAGDPTDIVCDDCYKKFYSDYLKNKEEYIQYREQQLKDSNDD